MKKMPKNKVRNIEAMTEFSKRQAEKQRKHHRMKKGRENWWGE